jgi:hypothetical protein
MPCAPYFTQVRNDTPAAALLFEQALLVAPGCASTLCNYATFLENSLGKLDEAEMVCVCVCVCVCVRLCVCV